MATKKKGILSRAPEWAKHLRSYNKRRFWKQHRKKESELYERDGENDDIPKNKNR